MELGRLDKPSVLVIDDDDRIRRLLLDILSERHRCSEASSAETALILLAQERFDLVILDINLGGMSGIELVPHVHSMSADSIVLMVSGQNNIETAIEAMRAGAFDYILKPFAVSQVEEATERALRKSFLLKEKERCKDPLDRLLTERSDELNQLARYDTLESSLRNAIPNGELVLHYQPRVSTDSLHITGVEALVRWQHSQLGLLLPGAFIPLAEELDLLSPISDWVLRTACSQNRDWQQRGFPPMRIAVNISARECQQLLLAETVRQVLEETGLEPKFLELELTESSIMSDTQVTLDVLKSLKAMNVTISVDDFGTGFSSLSYLKRLPIDALKIDKSFVQDVTTDQNDAALVMAIVALAHNLRLQVVAEGVETEEQLKFLHLLRCDEAQGYLFSKPLPAQQVERVLRTEPAELLSYLELQVCKG